MILPKTFLKKMLQLKVLQIETPWDVQNILKKYVKKLSAPLVTPYFMIAYVMQRNMPCWRQV